MVDGGQGMQIWPAKTALTRSQRQHASTGGENNRRPFRCSLHHSQPPLPPSRSLPPSPHLHQLGHESGGLQLLRRAHRLLQVGRGQVVGEQALAQALTLLGGQVGAGFPGGAGGVGGEGQAAGVRAMGRASNGWV